MQILLSTQQVPKTPVVLQGYHTRRQPACWRGKASVKGPVEARAYRKDVCQAEAQMMGFIWEVHCGNENMSAWCMRRVFFLGAAPVWRALPVFCSHCWLSWQGNAPGSAPVPGDKWGCCDALGSFLSGMPGLESFHLCFGALLPGENYWAPAVVLWLTLVTSCDTCSVSASLGAWPQQRSDECGCENHSLLWGVWGSLLLHGFREGR